jgi:hypothetical protein
VLYARKDATDQLWALHDTHYGHCMSDDRRLTWGHRNGDLPAGRILRWKVTSAPSSAGMTEMPIPRTQRGLWGTIIRYWYAFIKHRKEARDRQDIRATAYRIVHRFGPGYALKYAIAYAEDLAIARAPSPPSPPPRSGRWNGNSSV